MTRQLIAENRAAGERLDVYLAETLGITRNKAQQLVQNSLVLVNSQAKRVSYLVQIGDTITVTQAAAPIISSPKPPQLPVIYQDDDLLVIDKPAGITVHSGSGTASQATVADFARLHTTDPDPKRPGIVHRLDKNTSGLLIIAKTPQAKDYLQEQFKQHAIRKTYQLLIVGHINPSQAVINLPLDRDPIHPLRRAVVASGRPATTHYRVTAAYPGFSLIEASPKTGRTHQLRVHFASLGHPIVGDTTYGWTRSDIKLSRQFLHAAALEFTAPSGKLIQLQSPLPPDLQRVINQLEKTGQ